MRKNAARKWLHFILDLLPLIVIPIFAINIINRSPEPISVEVGETEQVVDIQYKYQSNEVNTLDDLVEGNIYYSSYLNLLAESDDDFYFQIDVVRCDSCYIEYDSNTAYLPQYSLEDLNWQNGLNIQFKVNPNESVYDLSYMYNFYDWVQIGDKPLTFDLEEVYFRVTDNLNGFKYWANYFEFSIEYTDFNIIQSVDVYEQGTTVVYDDTDIGSQFLYTVYHAVDEYFNFDNVFNFGELKAWLGTNLFGGTMPMVAVIVYNIIIYELMMDLLFLIYGVFMFIIDCGECMLERPFNKRGR